MTLRKIPSTVGFNSDIQLVARIHRNGLELVLWDLGGKEGIRNIWDHYYEEAQVLIFLLDGVDRSRFDESKKVFMELMTEKKLQGIPVLLLINKHDQENCASLGYVKEYFEIDEIIDHELRIMHISALTQ